MAGYHGHFLWHELMTTDPGGAKRFYPAVIGWTVTPSEIPDIEYDIWTTTPGGRAGGCMLLPREAQDMGAPTHWIPYIGTTDIDATYNRALELGARSFVPVTQIPGVGRFAVTADPQGAHFAMFQPDTGGSAPESARVGEFSWHELAANDVPSALDFYGALFGWSEFEAHDMGEMGTYHIFGVDGTALGGAFKLPPDMPSPPNWLNYIRVEDIDAVVGHVRDGGGRVLNGPMEVPGGDMIAQCMDPQGGAFAVHLVKSQA